MATESRGKELQEEHAKGRVGLSDRSENLAMCKSFTHAYHRGSCSGALFPADGGGAVSPYLHGLYLQLSNS